MELTVFFSWSGKRSKALADELSELLRQIFNKDDYKLRPCISSNDIEAGMKWSPELLRQLSEINISILCLTEENIKSSWIMFEAGALQKHNDNNRVIPYLLDVELRRIADSPLHLLQSKEADMGGTLGLILAINSAFNPPAWPVEALEEIFPSYYWPDYKKKIDKINEPISTKISANDINHIRELVSNLEEAASTFINSTKLLVKVIPAARVFLNDLEKSQEKKDVK